MDWQLNSDRPVYIQLVEQLELRIVSGSYSPGDKLESVRELAADAAVNPNTMQRALQELETRGLVNTQRTSGRTITDDTKAILLLRKTMATDKITAFFESMRGLGYTEREILDLIQNRMEDRK